MDRLKNVLASGTLALLLGTLVTASGCRSTKNEVPAGKPYTTTGEGSPGVGFNSDPRPNTAMGSGLYGNGFTPGMPGAGGGAAPGGMSPSSGLDNLPAPGAGGSQFGTPTPNQPSMGVPTNNRYQAPGTAGYGTGQ